MRQRFRRISFLVPVLFFLWITGISYGENESEWCVQIQIPSCTMTVYCNDTEWKRYPIAAGKHSTPTPQGVFEIISKVRNPTWFPPKKRPVPPGPRNPLGHYWMGFYGGYGIHGNNNSRSIGRHVSNGCIRMRNEDVAELFRVLPMGSPVVITYNIFEIKSDPDERLKIRAYPDVYHRYTDATIPLMASLQWEAPDYPANIKGTVWALGDKRPAEVEIPRNFSIAIDDQPLIEDGFQIGDKFYIPNNIVCLWGFTPDSAFIDSETLVKEYGVHITPNPDRLLIKTIRVYYANKLSAVRGRFFGEPLVEIDDLIGFTKANASFNPKSKALIYGGRLIKDCYVYNNHGWLGVSRLNELNLSARWDPVQLRVDIVNANDK